MSDFKIRKAKETDIDFIKETIFAAEKSGTETLAYSSMFDITENDFSELLNNILSEDIQGQELCISDFLIAEKNNQYAGACCGWIEGEYGSSSSLKANILLFYLGNDKISAASGKMKIADALHLSREAGTLQLESIYIKQEYRGQGLLNLLFEEHLKLAIERKSDLSKIQIQLMKTNENALRAYSKLGYEIIDEKFTDNPEILRILPSNHKVMMQKNI